MNNILSLKQGSAEWEKLRKRGRENLYWFNHTVLGFGSILPMSFRAHYGMCRFAERKTGIPIIDNSRVQLIQVHRGFGKSALVTQGRSIQRFTINRDWAIGIGNERQLNANAFLGSIKAIFEQNEFLKFLYPEIIPNFRKTTWKEDRIVIQRTPGKPNPVNPSVLAAGVGATVTGVHMNEWIIDDLISKDAAENARSGSFSEIEKANRFIVQLPPLLTHPTRDPLTFIGTPWWLGDCYDFIEETFGGEGRGNVINWRLKLPDGSHQTIKLIQKGDLAIFRMPAIDEEGRAINEPMGFTLEELEKTRRIDPVFFAAQYLLNPSGGDAADFRLDWLKPFQWDNPNTTRFTDIDGRTRSYNIHETSNIISVDPAISSKEGSADSAIAVTGTDGRHILLYEGWVDRVSPTDLAHQILTFYQRYRASSIVIESVGYQEALGDVLEMLAKNEYGIRERLPIHEHVTGSSHKKEVRIRGLEPYFRRGLFYYHHTSEDFIRQYQGFPHIKLRDLLDALSFQREQWERLALHGEIDDFRGGMVGKRSAAIKRQVNRIKDRYARRRRGGDRHYG